jgi:serine/threonine protein kinase
VINFSDPPRRSLTRDDPSAFAAPAHFGPFRVLHQIGVGALGPVFRTYEPERDRLVAVKAFRLDITPEQARSLADELARAADAGLFHPSIVEPIAAGVEGSLAYNAEEYVAAESLDVAMRHYAPSRIETVLPFITQLAGAIDFARTVGVGHGALHPRDIFITPEEARATGFGVVEALERVGLRAPVRRPYSPPERIAGTTWSTEADVFSLAAITFELLTGRRPAGLGAEIGQIAAADDAVARALHSVLARAMSDDPSRRYQTALAFASALDAASHGRTDERPSGIPSAGETTAAPTDDVAAIGTALEATPSPGPQPATKDALGAFFEEESFEAEEVALEEQEAGGEDEGPEEESEEADISLERNDDEAHHQLTLKEMSEPAPPELGSPMDDDSAIEAEADRYSGDDFLLDAAGAASGSGLASPDEFARRGSSPGARVMDEVTAAKPPSGVSADEFGPDTHDRRTSPKAPPAVAAAAMATARGPATYGSTFDRYTSPIEDVPAPEPRSRWPLALTLLLGLIAGFAGGYALWGRSATAPSESREFSEQAVGRPADARPSAGAAAKPPASPAPASGQPAAGQRSSTPPPVRGDATQSSAGASSGGAASSASVAVPPAERSPARATSGALTVRSTPAGAGVSVNGRWRGRTPLTLEKLAFGRYDVRVVQPGYQAARETVTLSSADASRSLSVRLQQETRPSKPAAAKPAPAKPAPFPSLARPQKFTGAIYVDSRPRGASVFVDGRRVGVTPIRVPDVPIGAHVVRLELPDHQIWSVSARVTAGEQARVTGSLERIQ